MKKVYVAIIGCGTVGGGTLDILTENREVIMRKSGADVTAVEKAIGDLKTESVVLDLNSGRVEIFTAPVGKSDLIAAIDAVKKAIAGASVGEVFGILE